MVTNSEPTVFVVDDDPAMRESLRWLIESAGLPVETYGGAQEFLDAGMFNKPGCLLLDVRMPGMTGLELQEKLAAQPLCHPVIIITGHGDVPMAVRAMRAGVVDFIQKPFSDAALLERIDKAIKLDGQTRSDRTRQMEIAGRMDRLTPRERQVMGLVVDGKANKQTAAVLGISQKTVEIHRANVMKKTGAESLAELVRMAQDTRAVNGHPPL